ncbi:MAG: molybdenum ABC transporter substrate-binding protein [Candidatus Nitrosopolaris wilkensis]|nr:MAG: molybdenum ABC transporter substrate-binding protein [Candidatus Nitrosopolaris wilkensis]
MDPLRRKHIIVLGRTTAIPTTTLLILNLVLVFFSYSFFGQENQTVNAQATPTTTSAGGDVNVLYAGSLISVMETKIGPAFSHLGYGYKGEGHGSIQDANMIIDGQRFPDVFISVGVQPITKLIDNNPSLAKWYLGFASDELVIAYNPKSHFAADLEKAKAGTIPWYQTLAKPGFRFLRTDPFLDPKGCYTIITTKLAGILYHNSSLSSFILNGERNPDQLRPEEILFTLLETGEADAIPAYKHEAIERGFPFLSLPPQINLGDPASASYYKQASCTQQNGSLNFGKPIVFDITIPNTVKNTEDAIQFVKFLFSDHGKKIFENDGFKLLSLTAGGNKTAIPQEISVLTFK